jgi:hypothetical protein
VQLKLSAFQHNILTPTFILASAMKLDKGQKNKFMFWETIVTQNALTSGRWIPFEFYWDFIYLSCNQITIHRQSINNQSSQ